MNSNTTSENYCDVHMVDTPERTISYRSGLTVYEESLIKGRFVGRSWGGSGFLNFYEGRLDPAQHFAPQAFWLEVDGQLLSSEWEWVDADAPVGAGTGAGASPVPTDTHTVVTLRHRIRPITVKVHTVLDGTSILTRWLEITNTDDKPAAIAAAYTWSGVLQKMNRWQLHVPQGQALYSIGYMDNPHWGARATFNGAICLPQGIALMAAIGATVTAIPCLSCATTPPASTSLPNWRGAAVIALSLIWMPTRAQLTALHICGSAQASMRLRHSACWPPVICQHTRAAHGHGDRRS